MKQCPVSPCLRGVGLVVAGARLASCVWSWSSLTQLLPAQSLTRNLLQVPVPKQQHRHQLLPPNCFCQKDYFRYTAICAELSFSSVSVGSFSGRFSKVAETNVATWVWRTSEFSGEKGLLFIVVSCDKMFLLRRKLRRYWEITFCPSRDSSSVPGRAESDAAAVTAISSQLLCGAPRPGEWRRFREQRRGDGQQQQREERVRGHGRLRHHHYRELRRGRPSQLLRGAAAPPSLEKPSDFSGDKFGRHQD